MTQVKILRVYQCKGPPWCTRASRDTGGAAPGGWTGKGKVCDYIVLVLIPRYTSYAHISKFLNQEKRFIMIQ